MDGHVRSARIGKPGELDLIDEGIFGLDVASVAPEVERVARREDPSDDAPMSPHRSTICRFDRSAFSARISH